MVIFFTYHQDIHSGKDKVRAGFRLLTSGNIGNIIVVNIIMEIPQPQHLNCERRILFEIAAVLYGTNSIIN